MCIMQSSVHLGEVESCLSTAVGSLLQDDTVLCVPCVHVCVCVGGGGAQAIYSQYNYYVGQQGG